jgi:hypothetical protein
VPLVAQRLAGSLSNARAGRQPKQLPSFWLLDANAGLP